MRHSNTDSTVGFKSRNPHLCKSSGPDEYVRMRDLQQLRSQQESLMDSRSELAAMYGQQDNPNFIATMLSPIYEVEEEDTAIEVVRLESSFKIQACLIGLFLILLTVLATLWIALGFNLQISYFK